MRKKNYKGAFKKAPSFFSGGKNTAPRQGELVVHRDGYGFVLASRAGEEDLFIPARFIGDAMHTDVVMASEVGGRAGKKEGRINRIAERRVRTLMGRLERTGAGAYQVIADDKRVRHRIFIPTNKLSGAKHGDNVTVRIVRYPEGQKPMTGEIERVVGKRGEEETEKTAVIVRHQLKRDFPENVVKEASKLHSMINDEEVRRRVDLRHLPFVTIDGETAKDFDDAVAVEKLDNGNIRLWVSIADVSFFVRHGTAIDRAAYERSTSVYYPGDCLPMLPEAISNDLCSLLPRENRFTMTAEMDVAPDGSIARSRFYRSVINSRERMTYTAVKKILVDKDESVLSRYSELVLEFKLMEECYDWLRGMRQRRGSLDFDLPEPLIVIDMQGDVEDIIRAERHIGHMMIEDFMIAANEAVAEYLTGKKTGCIYRVHESPLPEKLQEFSVLMHNLGFKFHIGEGSPKNLARAIELVRGRPEERLVNHMLLRSMSRAVYSPENKGHYGLASKCYCHFTSPIRRYPDLVVHRLLTAAFGKQDSSLRQVQGAAKVRGLVEIAENTSRMERIAMESEREMAKLYAAFFMQSKIGEEFDGIVSHVTKFGFFVELVEFFVEGLVNLDAIDNDVYAYEEEGMVIKGKKTKRQFKIGDKVRIEVTEVDIVQREISFSVV